MTEIKRDEDLVQKSYDAARRIYAGYGIDTGKAMEEFAGIPVSLHSWQGDDVRGFEGLSGVASQNLVTGSYPGAARNGDELRMDIDTAFSMTPCKPRVNLQSIYAEPETKKERNEFTAEDFSRWIAWAKKRGYGLDFNESYFTHPMIADGFSLASRDKKVRDYWIKAGKGARGICDAIGRELGTPCWNALWVPDGLKDLPANRLLYREYLKDSLDQIFEKKYDRRNTIDVMEGKLFGIGTECFTVGSHEFYLAYAAKNGLGVCMDTGHYRPAESVADKLSSIALFVDDIFLHISRGVHWDSDHVLIQGDDLQDLMTEMKRGGFFHRVAMGLDYFDASINRMACWVIGLRAAGKSILAALLEPTQLLEEAEAKGDFTTRLALTDEFKNLPVNAVWDMACLRAGVPVGTEWISRLKRYEADVQSKRR